MFTFDLSLKNEDLYEGCDIIKSKGHSVLLTNVAEAKEIIEKNVIIITERLSNSEREAVTLTGVVDAWVYLAVFRHTVHNFREVFFDDGRRINILISKNWGRRS